MAQKLKIIWSEDDAGTFDRTRGWEVWKFLFGTDISKAKKEEGVTIDDQGDCTYYTFPNGVVYYEGFDGTEISVPEGMEVKEVPNRMFY